MRYLCRIVLVAVLSLPISSVWAVVSLQYKISGIAGEPVENADKRLKGKLALIKQDLDQDQMMSFYRQAENEIKLAVAPYGYFRANVSSNLSPLGTNRWFAHFYVRPGPKNPPTSLECAYRWPG